jgi:hypothetical protein
MLYEGSLASSLTALSGDRPAHSPPRNALEGTSLPTHSEPSPDNAVSHRRWVSRADAVAVYAGDWGSHRCSDCPCFRCVTLRWARKPKCSCGHRTSRLKRTLGLDDTIRKRRLQCKCRPPTQVWGTFWCLCEKTPQWSRSGSPRFLIAEDEGRYPEATLDGSSGSDVDADSPRSRTRRRMTF